MKTGVGDGPDRAQVDPGMRVGDAVASVRGFYPKWTQARCDELMKVFERKPDRRAKHLSKGQAAKLSLLLSICHEPQVLLFDEPTSGLDPLVREEFLEGVLAVTSEKQ